MNPIRILHVLGALDYGGIETWIMQILHKIKREEIQIDFCCLSGRAGALAYKAEALGSRIHLFRLDKDLVRFNSWFRELLITGAYDIIHSHVHKFSGYILWRAARAGIVGRIAHSFTFMQNQNKTISRSLYECVMDYLISRYATAELGNSEHSMKALFGKDWHLDTRCKVLYCGIDLAAYKIYYNRKVTLSQYGIPESSRVIGHLGRFSPEKNHRFIIDIIAEMQSRRSDVWFLLIGDGELRGRIVEQARALGIKRLIFAERIIDVEVVAGLQSMDLLLFPSIREGLPQAVLEAQACGLRCLCSDNITPEVMIMPEAVQFLSLNKSAAQWADACADTISMPSLDRQLALKIMANSHFNIDHSVNSLTNVYRSMYSQ